MIETLPDESESKLERFRVRFHDGSTWSIAAATWRRQLTPDDEVKFDAGKNVQIDQVFFRASDVSAIAPDLQLDVEPFLSALQEQINILMARMDSLDSNLVEVVMRAVSDVLAQRGL